MNLHESWKLLPYQSDHEIFAAEAKKRIQNFFARTYEEQRTYLENSDIDGDTWIFPTLEMGQLDIHHDSVVMKKILAAADKGSVMNMATGGNSWKKDRNFGTNFVHRFRIL